MQTCFFHPGNETNSVSVVTKSRQWRFQVPDSVQWAAFWTTHVVFRLIMFCCVKVRAVRPFPVDLPGGFLLATNHNSHLDAHVLGTLIPRKIDWISRVEFFRHKIHALLLHLVSAIPIHRQGVPVRAIRTAIERLRKGKNIGICPEGEVRAGEDSVIYGGKIKQGVGLLAYHARVPVLPCVILGVEQLCRVEPWLPMRRGEVWMNFGTPIEPRIDLGPKAARQLLCQEIESQMRELFTQMQERFDIPDSILP